MFLIMHTLRLVFGLSMLAAAAVLTLPFTRVVAAVVPGVSWGLAPTHVAPPTMPGLQIGTSGGVAGHAIPDPLQPPSTTAVPAAGLLAGPESSWPEIAAAAVPRFVPPPPVTAPLPPNRIDLSPAAPTLDGTYRSTVDIPPPPLLDLHAAPPLAAGWTARSASRPSPTRGIAAADQASEYVIRDGDDLTGIALRTYGHAAAATAIWNANRDRLADPNVLPIGLALALPPAWTLPAGSAAAGSGRSPAIEPGLGAGTGLHAGSGLPLGTSPDVGRGSEAMSSQADDPGRAEAPWLSGQDLASAMPAVPTALAAAPAGRPRSIRVAPGDSLESLAVRLYGDRTRAASLWQANRDRLRSPELLVPGMDLRIP